MTSTTTTTTIDEHGNLIDEHGFLAFDDDGPEWAEAVRQGDLLGDLLTTMRERARLPRLTMMLGG